jgi:ABC-type uncharacterized transport system substrate-binding protein
MLCGKGGGAWLLLALSLWLWSGVSVAADGTLNKPPGRILAVMSYEVDNSWTVKVREGIAQALANYEVKYFYLNTKHDKEGGWTRAREALALLQEFRPDAVIAADDNAQEMFVVPYLRGKSSLPVVFCGVNDDAAKFGYPSGNVTGVLEIKHYVQTISFAKLIIKDLRKLAVIYKETPSNVVNLLQIQREMGSYPVELTDYLSVSSMAEAKSVLAKIKHSVQAVLILNLSGITDDQGIPMDNSQVIAELRKIALPMISTQDYAIEAGALCGVVQLGWEQGFRAGQIVREIMGGKKPGEIPVERNVNGQRYLNLTTARQLNLPLGREVILGSKLIR